MQINQVYRWMKSVDLFYSPRFPWFVVLLPNFTAMYLHVKNILLECHLLSNQCINISSSMNVPQFLFNAILFSLVFDELQFRLFLFIIMLMQIKYHVLQSSLIKWDYITKINFHLPKCYLYLSSSSFIYRSFRLHLSIGKKLEASKGPIYSI